MGEGNLFSPSYTSGDLSSINFIADWLGKISVVVISIVGFGIVIFTILKNAMHGLYAVSPKFWDRVDEAKKAALGTGDGGNQISKVIGSISIVLLNMLPNVKAMTDFEDEQLDPKAYFMTAIPMACIQIFIGVFIFFGYPARVAEKFSDFGRGLFDVVLLNVDPIAWVDSLPNKFIRYNLSTDGSVDPFDKSVNKATLETINTFVGNFEDMTKESRATVAKELESWLLKDMVGFADYAGNPDKYKLAVQAGINLEAPDISRFHDKHGDGVHTFAIVAPVSQFSHGSAKQGAENMFVRVNFTFIEKAMSGSATDSVDNTAAVPNSFWTATAEGTIMIKFSDVELAGASIYGGASAKARGQVGNIKVYLEAVGSNSLKVTPMNSSDKIPAGVTTISNIDGVRYSYSNKSHRVTGISASGSGSKATFTPTTNKDIKPWMFGEGPVVTQEEGGTGNGGSSSDEGNTQGSGGSGDEAKLPGED